MRRTCSIVAIAAALFLPVSPATGQTTHRMPLFRVVVVDRLSPSELQRLAARGAVGLLVPEIGPTTNRRQALAALVRGAEVNARLGGVPTGKPLLFPSGAKIAPTAPRGTIVVALPAAGRPRANDRRYPIAVIGRGFHGLLASPTTRIAGLVSIVDLAPTALGHRRGSLSSTPSTNAVARLATLDRQIHANNRLKLPALIIVACASMLLAAIRPRAVLPAVLAALLVNVALGAAQVSSEPLIVAVLLIGCIAGGLGLARICRSESRLLSCIAGVVAVYTLVFALRPSWAAVTPLGPTQNSRFWGMGNQLETLMLAPLLTGAWLAARRFGWFGFTAFALSACVFVTDNRLGSDGGGAIVLGVALAFVGARVFRVGARGFAILLLLASTLTLAIVSLNLGMPGPDHLRSAFGHGLPGMMRVAENRLPLAYLPALHEWPLLLPLALWFGGTVAIALRTAPGRASRDLVVALGLAVATSLLVNDSAAYELAGGVVAISAVARFRPTPVVRLGSALARIELSPQPIPNEAGKNSLR
jgi:hypothetical protein